MIHRTVPSLQKALDRRFTNYVRSAFEACDDAVAKATLEDMIDLTSGSQTKAEQRAEGHPYGKGPRSPSGKPRARRALLPINRQTHRLQQGIRLVRRDEKTGRFSRTAEWRVEIHGVDYAKFVVPKRPDPRSKMLYRPLWEELDRRRRRHLFDLKREFRQRTR